MCEIGRVDKCVEKCVDTCVDKNEQRTKTPIYADTYLLKLLLSPSAASTISRVCWLPLIISPSKSKAVCSPASRLALIPVPKGNDGSVSNGSVSDGSVNDESVNDGEKNRRHMIYSSGLQVCKCITVKSICLGNRGRSHSRDKYNRG